MTPYQVVIKRIISPEGKVIAELKSIVATSNNNQADISQNVSVEVSSDYSSTSGSISAACGHKKSGLHQNLRKRRFGYRFCSR